jgi:hypothetical protein
MIASKHFYKHFMEGRVINRLLKYLILVEVYQALGCLPAWGEDKIVDVNMPSPFVALPFSIGPVQKHPWYPAALVADERVKQESGPEAEVTTAYRNADYTWAVWARLPDVTGEFTFSKVGSDEGAAVKVTEVAEHPYAYQIAIQPTKGSAKVEANTQLILLERAVLLPIQGSVKQISGPATILLPDKSSAEKVWAKIPYQVCTLIFETQGRTDRAVVRVWLDKDNRCFVSGKNGNDANPGTEDKPFKTLPRAVTQVRNKPDQKGQIYIAGGKYDLGLEKMALDYQISIFGGFDENGWRRDPIITESVLLPHAFCENWIDELTDRHKDLRRAEPRYHETQILRDLDKKHPMDTLSVGVVHGPGYLKTAGTPDTYIDGVTIFGPNENRTDKATTIDAPGQNKRTVRNCILIHCGGFDHDFITSSCGDDRFENNIIWGGISETKNNTRCSIVGSFGRWNRNLIVGPSGGSYTRILCLWGEGGMFTENQIHGGDSFGWSGMQAEHRAILAERLNVFRKNVLYLDCLFNPFNATGLVMEDNDIHLFQNCVVSKFKASKALTIRNNNFYLAPSVVKEKLWPKDMTQKLGGKFEVGIKDMGPEKYIEPEGVGTGAPIIENNKFTTMEKPDKRVGNLVDVKKLHNQVLKVGPDAALRPKDPAKNLRGQVTGNGTVSLTWDESADLDVVGYIVRYGQKSNSYQNPTFLGKVKSAEIKNLQQGDWYFTVVPIKEGNVECWKLSNEVRVEVK